MEEPSEDVPSLFICPISLQIMRDPVTISTGMTFDRESIQKWLSSYKKTTCPITKQPLAVDPHLITPNSNLRRLIQSWHLDNDSSSTSRKPKDQEEEVLALTNYAGMISLLLEEIKQQPSSQETRSTLRKIRSLLVTRGINGVVNVGDHDDDLFPLVSSIVSKKMDELILLQGVSDGDQQDGSYTVIDEAMSILCLLSPSNQTLISVSHERNGSLLKSLCSIITRYSSFQAKVQSALVLKSAFKVVHEVYKAGLGVEFFESLTEILKDQNSKQGSLAVLGILVQVLSFGRNKEKAIKAGLVPVLVELLAEDSNERRACEMMLVVLEKLCKKAEGREAFLAHPIGMAAVLSKVLGVSHLGNDRVVSLFLWVFRFCKRGEVAVEFMEVGGVSKVWMLVQSGCCSLETKVRAREILGLHLREWNRSPCFPHCFRNSENTIWV